MNNYKQCRWVDWVAWKLNKQIQWCYYWQRQIELINDQFAHKSCLQWTTNWSTTWLIQIQKPLISQPQKSCCYDAVIFNWIEFLIEMNSVLLMKNPFADCKSFFWLQIFLLITNLFSTWKLFFAKEFFFSVNQILFQRFKFQINTTIYHKLN